MENTYDSWSSQYKHPLWQKLRLEVMQRDEFCCVICHDGDSQLQVHHCIYRNGAKIWEYIPDALMTLCDDCHNKIHKVRDKCRLMLSRLEASHQNPHVPNSTDICEILELIVETKWNREVTPCGLIEVVEKYLSGGGK